MNNKKETKYNSCELLGADRIKISISDSIVEHNLALFDMANPQKLNLKNMYAEKFWFKKHTDINFGLYILKCYSNINKRLLLSTSLRIDVNVPKLIYGNNVYESTYKDLYNACISIVSILNGYGIHCTKEDILNSPLIYLEIGRNCKEKINFDDIYLNIRSFDKKQILQTKYKYGKGKGIIFKNTKNSLSFYDKNLELKTFTPNNSILSLLKKKGLSITRLEQKYNGKQEIYKHAQKYIYEHTKEKFSSENYITINDLLNTNIGKILIYNIWENYKLHTNIFDISNINIHDIFTFIKNSKLGIKMKEGLITFITGLKNRAPFDFAFNFLKNKFSINYRNKVLRKYEDIMSLFSVPTYSFIDIIDSNIYRIKPIQDFFLFAYMFITISV